MRYKAIDLLDGEILKRYQAGAAPDSREAALAVIEALLEDKGERLPTGVPSIEEALDIFTRKLVSQAREDCNLRSAIPEYIRIASKKIRDEQN